MGEAPSYLALALAAGASAGGAWCGVVGLPGFGIAAASGMGADLGRFLMVDEPGERWAEAVNVLAGAVDVVLVRPPRRPVANMSVASVPASVVLPGSGVRCCWSPASGPGRMFGCD
ncbi:hypothetical protein ACFQ9X_24450 [Catenulispora yoronensis]